MPFATNRGLTLHYRVSGPDAGRPLVLLNSLGTDCRIWDPLAARLDGRYRILRYDQRGQGLSDAPDGPYSVADHADDLEALLNRLGSGPAALCGLSIGGMIALEASSRRTGLVRALVLADTAEAIGPREFWDERMRQVEGDGVARIAEPVMQRWFGASFRAERPGDVRGWANLLARAPVAGYLGSCAALRDGDVSEAAARVAVPTLCVCGSEDAATPPEVVQRLAQRIRGAEYAELEGAGHLAPVEQPDEFAQLVVRFMEANCGV